MSEPPYKVASNDRLQLGLTDDGASFDVKIFSDRNADPEAVLTHLREAYRADKNGTYRPSIQLCADAIKSGVYENALAAIDIVVMKCTDRAIARHIKMGRDELRRHPWKGIASAIAARTFVGHVLERRQQDGWGQWKFAGTDTTVLQISAFWPTSQIIFEGGSEVLFRYLLLNAKQGDVSATNTARWLAYKEVPKHDYTLHPDKPLSEYQQLALVNAGNSAGYGLFMDAGTGKTPVVIARVCNEAEKVDHVYRALVVCPNNVRMNWAVETAQFATCIGKTTIIRGTSLARRKQIIDAFRFEGDEQFTMLIVSYETLSRIWDEISLIPWDLAVGDESHYFKNPTTVRFKTMMKLRDISKARMPLTGTPITNNALDLYAHWEFMGKGVSGFMSYKNFKSHFSQFRTGQGGHDVFECLKHVPEIKERLARTSFQIKLEDAVPDLPQKVYDVHEVEMTTKQAETYETVRTSLAIEAEEALDGDRPRSMVLQHILTMLLRLTQITSGYVVWDAEYSDDGIEISPKQIEDIPGGNPKIEALLEIAAEKGPHEKTIIWATFIHDIKNISAALTGAGHDVVEFYGATSDDDRDTAERRYNSDPKCKFFVGNPAAGGTGINLLGYDYRNMSNDPEAMLTNTTHEIYYSQNWSPVERSQSERRGYRRGSRAHIRITDLCVPQTIDEEIRARVLDKLVNALEISDVTSILQSVLGVTI